jgi:hypothetical protein
MTRFCVMGIWMLRFSHKIWVVRFELNIWFSSSILNFAARNQRPLMDIHGDCPQWSGWKEFNPLDAKWRGNFPDSAVWTSKLPIDWMRFQFQHARDSTLGPLILLPARSNCDEPAWNWALMRSSLHLNGSISPEIIRNSPVIRISPVVWFDWVIRNAADRGKHRESGIVKLRSQTMKSIYGAWEVGFYSAVQIFVMETGIYVEYLTAQVWLYCKSSNFNAFQEMIPYNRWKRIWKIAMALRRVATVSQRTSRSRVNNLRNGRMKYFQTGLMSVSREYWRQGSIPILPNIIRSSSRSIQKHSRKQIFEPSRFPGLGQCSEPQQKPSYLSSVAGIKTQINSVHESVSTRYRQKFKIISSAIQRCISPHDRHSRVLTAVYNV